MKIIGKMSLYRCLFWVVLLSFLIPLSSLAGERGYMISRENESVVEGSSGSLIWNNILWFTDKRVKIQNDQDKDHLIIIHMDEEKVYQLDLKSKRYKKMDLPDVLSELYKERSIESNRIEGTKRIGDCDCYGIKIITKGKDISFDAEYWLTETIEVPAGLRKKVAKYFGPDQVKLTEELAKYKGYPILASVTMNVNDKKIKVITRVKEIKEMDIDPKVFEIPKDFEPVEMARGGSEVPEADPNIAGNPDADRDPNALKGD